MLYLLKDPNSDEIQLKVEQFTFILIYGEREIDSLNKFLQSLFTQKNSLKSPIPPIRN